MFCTNYSQTNSFTSLLDPLKHTSMVFKMAPLWEQYVTECLESLLSNGLSMARSAVKLVFEYKVPLIRKSFHNTASIQERDIFKGFVNFSPYWAFNSKINFITLLATPQTFG